MSACGRRLPFLPRISRFYVKTDNMIAFKSDNRFKPFDMKQIETESKLREVYCIFEDPPEEDEMKILKTFGVTMVFITPATIKDFYSIPYVTPLYPNTVSIMKPYPSFQGIKRIKIYTRYDKYFHEVYRTIQSYLDKLTIPHSFLGTYFGTNTVEQLDDDTLYFFISAPEVIAPKPGRNSPVLLWYFEQPTSGYFGTDSQNGWFNLPDAILSPWYTMQLNLFREYQSRHVIHLPYKYSPTLSSYNIPSSLPQIDIFFCGCLNERRIILQRQMELLPYKVVFTNAAFGQELDEYIRRSKIVLNLHYYPNALLEVHRINRMLAYDVCVVSERSNDPQTDTIYEKYIDYCTIESMPAYVKGLLESGAWSDKTSRAAMFRQEMSEQIELEEILKRIE